MLEFTLVRSFLKIGSEYKIFDSNKKQIFQAKGNLFTFKNRMILQDMDGTELYSIKHKSVSLLHQYSISKNNKPLVTIKKNFSLITNIFNLDFNESKSYLALSKTGFNHFKIKPSKKKTVATIDRVYLRFARTYKIKTSEEDKGIYFLLAAIIFDQIGMSKKR